MKKNYVTLGELATYVNGYAFKPTDWSDEGLEIIRIQNLTGNLSEVNRYSGEYNKKYEVNNGDVLISWSASLGVYVWNKGRAILNQHIFKVVFNKVDVDKEFFIQQVGYILERANVHAHGATMKHLTRPVFDSLKFYLPSREEQKDISNKLCIVDRLIELHEKQVRDLEQLVKSRFIEMFGNPVNNKNSIPLKNFIKNIRYGTSTPPMFSDKGYAFIRATNIKAGRIVKNDMRYISDVEAKKIPKCLLKGGEMIIVRSGINAGDTCIITNEYKGNYAGYDIIIEFCDEINPAYINELFNTHYMNFVIKPLTRRAAQPHLNSEQVQNLPIIYAPLALQNQFADFVERTNKSKFTHCYELLLLIIKKIWYNNYV